MANRALQRPIEGESRIGDGRPNIRGLFYVEARDAPGLGSVLALDAVDNTGVISTWYLFIASDGDLRVSETFPTNTNTDGTVVGGQS